MTLGELITITRSLTGDTNGNAYLRSDDELIIYANEAEREACRRAELLVDRCNEVFCEVVIDDESLSYEIDKRILSVKNAKIEGYPKSLIPTSLDALEEDFWQEDIPHNVPTHYAIEPGMLWLNCYPSSSGILKLRVVRLPFKKMIDIGDSPEIDERWHFGLVYYMCHLAYMKEDTEGESMSKMGLYLDKFTEVFGGRPTAKQEILRNRIPKRAVMHGIRFEK